jgi:RNA polymerase sigma-70 factor, ECF subfamily
MEMATGEADGDRGSGGARGEPVVAAAISPSATYAAHGEALRGHLVRLTRDPAAAEDLVQETFIRLLSEIRSGRPPVHARAWLFRVAANLATSRARHQGVATRRAPHLVRGGVAPSPEDEMLDREAARALSNRLDSLPHHVRAALLLTAYGYSGGEIARIIGRSEVATRSLLSRHRSRLRSAPPAA